jgi:benzodiazapine receptor
VVAVRTSSLQIPGLIGWLALTYAAAAVGAIASTEAGTFYQELARPAWAPPGWLFAPVWSTLYFLMAIAAWLVWRQNGFRGAALTLYIAQLVLNALWTWIYFVWRDGMWAFVEIVVLWAFILATLVAFWRLRPLAGALLIPYLAWVSFATALTYATWRANPQLLGYLSV